MSLKKFIKENFVLAVGITLPVLLVAAFFFASVLPKSMAVPPQYELLFTSNRYDSQNPPVYVIDFIARDGMLKAQIGKGDKSPSGYGLKTLMAYDGKTQSVRELPYNLSTLADIPHGAEVVLDEFKDMKVDGSTKAPDGYAFDNNGYYSGGPATAIFGGSRGAMPRVIKGPVAFKIPSGRNSYYYNDIRFVGWVIK